MARTLDMRNRKTWSAPLIILLNAQDVMGAAKDAYGDSVEIGTRSHMVSTENVHVQQVLDACSAGLNSRVFNRPVSSGEPLNAGCDIGPS